MSSNTAVRIVMHGARGRMGTRIVALAHGDERFNVVASIDRDDVASADELRAGTVDVVIDFSSDHGARRAAQLADQLGAALLVGTTALSPETLDLLEKISHNVAVMIAANTSLGVAVLNHLAAEAARLLGSEYQIDIIESHHVMKKDAPSGTALRIVQAIRDSTGIDLPADRMHSIRAGDIIGEHTVHFAGPGERIQLSHSATNRDLFARGALRAAAWLHAQKPGLYTIEQSLGLS